MSGRDAIARMQLIRKLGVVRCRMRWVMAQAGFVQTAWGSNEGACLGVKGRDRREQIVLGDD